MSILEFSTRRIELEGCYNLRDTGGYATTDGRMTRWRTVFRADGLHRLPIASQEKLHGYAIRTIIDLRHPAELEKWPNVFARSSSVTYVSIPLVESPIEEGMPDTLEELNRKILDHSQPQVRRVFETLIAPGALPVLVHCTGGKDRTGLIVALLLSLLWVPDGTIAEDYALSAQYLGPLFEQMRQQARSTGRDIALPAKMLEARPECILEMLAYLRAEYGGAEEYLEVLGLVDWQREYLRESLTEPGER